MSLRLRFLVSNRLTIKENKKLHPPVQFRRRHRLSTKNQPFHERLPCWWKNIYYTTKNVSEDGIVQHSSVVESCQI